MAISNALANKYEADIIDNAFNTSASGNYTKPTAIWVGLCTGALPDGTTFPEVTQASYSRVAITLSPAASATAGSIPTCQVTGPAASVAYPAATASWGTIYGYGLFKASSGVSSTGVSQYLAYGEISPTVAVVSGDTVSFASGAMTFQFG
jgi:hypothetical protein